MDSTFTATLAGLRERYGGALASPGSARTRAIGTLRCQRSRWRKRNLADENIPAHILLVESGHLPVRSAFSHLADIGRLDELIAAGVSQTGIGSVQRIFVFTKKTEYEALTFSEVEACAKAPGPKPCGPRGEMAFVSGLRAAIDRVIEYRSRQGEVLANPIPRPTCRRAAAKAEDFPPHFKRDRDLLVASWKKLSLSRSTKLGWEKWFWAFCRWLVESDMLNDDEAAAELDRSGPCVMFMDFERVRRLCLYKAEAHADGRRKSGSTIDSVLNVVRHMHLVGQGENVEESKADHFVDDVKRSFRRGKRRRGPYNAGVEVRTRQVDPGLSDAEVKVMRADFREELRRVEAQYPVPRRKLLRLRRDHVLMELELAVGPRIASVASFRADLIKRQPDGTYWVRCLIKHPYLRTSAPVTPEERVGDQTFSWWMLPAEIMGNLIELLKEEGSDLKRWLESKGKDRDALAWVDVTEDETFGVVGRVAPIWFKGNNDYLRRGGIDAVLQRIVRVRGGRDLGAGMVLRRTASRTIQKAVEADPRLADELLHHNAAQNRAYAVEAVSSITSRYPTYDLATNALVAPTPAVAEVQPSPPAQPQRSRARGPKTKVSSPRFSMKEALNVGARRHRSTAA